MKSLLIFLLATVAWAGEEVRLPGLRIVGGDKKSVELTGKVAQTNSILEFLTVEPGGRDYESLLTVDCKPSALKFGLLLIGCDEGETNGSPLTIDVEWQAAGKAHRSPVESWLIDRHTGKPPVKLAFFLSGSGFVPDLFTTNKLFQADVEQAHIALWWQPSILINVHGESGNPYRDDAQGFEANPQVVPPIGTPIKLILRKRD
ncbi:MAG: YdjY domain-containing protein [Verrucomicrobiota bacterium]